MIEEWKSIEGFERYSVSSTGKVRRDSKNLILSKVLRKGYCIVNLYKENGDKKEFKVHRLVLSHFKPNHKNKPIVNHINGIRDDNRLENLEWSTSKENVMHAIRTGLFDPNIKGFQKKPVLQIDIKGNKIAEFNSITEAAESIGVHQSSISYAILGRQKTSKGYIWKYK